MTDTRQHYRWAAWWYACGRNDQRGHEYGYVDPEGFANHVQELYDAFFNHETHFLPSVQDAWTAYYANRENG